MLQSKNCLKYRPHITENNFITILVLSMKDEIFLDCVKYVVINIRRH